MDIKRSVLTTFTGAVLVLVCALLRSQTVSKSSVVVSGTHPAPTGILAYTSPTCTPAGPSGYLYSGGTAQNGWNGSGSTWACGTYPTVTPPSLPAAGCPTGTATTNACTAGYSTTVADPDTGNRVMRVSQAGSLNQAAGSQFYSFASGWRQAWNADSTKFIFLTDYGCAYDFVGFNPSNMTLTGESAYLPCKSEWNFSSTDPDLLYMLGSGWLQSYRISTAATTNIKQWSADPYWVAGESLVGMYVGGQTSCVYSGNPGSGTGRLVACYDLASSQSWVIDTNAATINGTPIAGVTTSGVTSLHSIAVGKDGNYVLIDTGYGSDSGCDTGTPGIHSQLMVNLRTGVGAQLGVYCHQTHWTIGYGGVMYQSVPSGTPTSCASYDSRGIALHSFGLIRTTPYPFVAGCFGGGAGATSSSHLSWNNNAPGSRVNGYPIIVDGYNDNSTSAYHCMGCSEIYAYSPAVANYTAKVTRFGRTWKTGSHDTPTGCTDYIYRTSTVSPDGRYAMFSSDWLGGTGAGGTCPSGRRQDLFVMELK